MSEPDKHAADNSADTNAGDERPDPDATAGAGAGPTNTHHPVPRIDAPSIYDVHEDEPCPACGVPLDHHAVVCVECGYDLRQARRLSAEQGEEYVEAPERPEAMVEKGRGPPQLWGVVGVILTLGAMIGFGIDASRAEAGFWAVVAKVALTGYLALLHTGTGVGALAIVGRGLGVRFSDTDHHAHGIDLAAARMFAGVGAFLLVLSCPFPWGGLGEAIRLFIGAGLYLLALRWLFGRPWTITVLIGSVHAVLAALLWVGSQLSAIAAG